LAAVARGLKAKPIPTATRTTSVATKTTSTAAKPSVFATKTIHIAAKTIHIVAKTLGFVTAGIVFVATEVLSPRHGSVLRQKRSVLRPNEPRQQLTIFIYHVSTH
jgi:hypothetical protein